MILSITPLYFMPNDILLAEVLGWSAKCKPL
jgi:hypothetical protein